MASFVMKKYKFKQLILTKNRLLPSFVWIPNVCMNECVCRELAKGRFKLTQNVGVTMLNTTTHACTQLAVHTYLNPLVSCKHKTRPLLCFGQAWKPSTHPLSMWFSAGCLCGVTVFSLLLTTMTIRNTVHWHVRPTQYIITNTESKARLN